MNKVTLKHVAILTFSLACIVIPCILLLSTGIVTPFISGFAVDALDRIYIGGTQRIYVFQEGNQIGTINPRTSRTYAFTITTDGNILLSTSTKVYILNLDGDVMSEYEDVAADIYNQIKYNSSEYKSSNGDVYKIRDYFGWTHIIKNNSEIVYRISFLSYAVKLLILGSVTAMIILPVYFAAKYFRRPEIN